MGVHEKMGHIYADSAAISNISAAKALVDRSEALWKNGRKLEAQKQRIRGHYDSTRKGVLLLKERFLILLIALFVFLILRSFLTHFGFSANLFIVPEYILFFSGLIAVSDKRRHLYIALCLFGASVAASASVLLMRESDFYLYAKSFELVFSALFYGYACLLITAFVLRDGKVTRDKLAAAICVYMLIGVTWGMFFALLEFTTPGSLSMGLDKPGADFEQEAIYFSFVTLTTLGYGDISPTSAPARTLAILEAILGQIYVAVMIARLVGLHIAHASQEDKSVESEKSEPQR